MRPTQIFAALYVSYALCYLCKRLNYKLLIEHGVVDVYDAGLFGSAFELTGGLSRLVGGVFIDTTSPSLVLTGSLLTVGIANLCFFLPPTTRGKVVLWGANGFAHALAWPALTRIFMAWFPDPARRGTWYSLLSTSMNAGAALAPHIIAGIIAGFADWRASMLCCGAVIVVYATAQYALVLRDSPAVAQAEVVAAAGVVAGANGRSGAAVAQRTRGGVRGAPSAEKQQVSPVGGPPPPPSLAEIAREVLLSPQQWLLGLSYLANTVVRQGLADWASVFLAASSAGGGDGGDPPHLVAAHGDAPAAKGESAAGLLALCLTAFEVGGATGGFLAGIVSDRVFRGRRGPVMLISNAALIPLPLLLLALSSSPAGSGSFLSGLPSGAVKALLPVVYAAAGLLSSAPHVLNGLASREFSAPCAQSSAGGFTKALGQVGGAIAGAPLGRFAARRGWGAAMVTLSCCAAAAALLSAPLWHTLARVAIAPPPRRRRGSDEANGGRGGAPSSRKAAVLEDAAALDDATAVLTRRRGRRRRSRSPLLSVGAAVRRKDRG